MRFDVLMNKYNITEKKLRYILKKHKPDQYIQEKLQIGIIFDLKDHRKIIKFCTENKIEFTIPYKFQAEYEKESKLNA